MFFEEDNSPRPEGWLGLIMALATGWYLFNYKKPMKEIVYMEFLNDYLLKNKITEIKIHVPGKELFAKKESKSFEESTDLCVEALRKQVKKHKEKTK